MNGKSVKLIIGVILVVAALALRLFTAVSYWLAILLAAIGLIFIILAFAGKERKLPAIAPQPESPTPAETKEEPESAPEEVNEGELRPRV